MPHNITSVGNLFGELTPTGCNSTPKPRVRTATTASMDQIFSHVSDQVALSGACGISLTTATTAVIPSPRPALLTYLRKQFEQQPLFTVTTTPTDSTIVAHPNLRRRALGFSPIEHPPLPQPAWTLLEAIGAAGPAGILQSQMGPIVALQPNMVHHYIGLLSARRLIGRRRTIIQRANRDVVVSTTYTAVIVLARYAAQMLDSESSTPAADVASDTRLRRILDVLRHPPHVRAERDLKIVAVPDSDRPPKMSTELFQRRRHRNYRSLRTKLIKLGAVEIVKRKCVTPNGRALGHHPCLRLLETAKNNFTGVGKEKRVSHPLLANGGDNFVAEVDIVEQIYRLLVDAGSAGIAVPELHEYLDSNSVTSAPAKRIRSIITAISKTHPTVERQYFEGSAMYLRISIQDETTPSDKAGSEKRRKIGVTALGENRQEIVMQLLQERKVLVLETLGREVARIEDGAVQKVDPKVMRRLIADLVAQKRAKLITTARPTIKDNPRAQTLVLVALPDVDERGDNVKHLVTSIVNRSLYGPQDEGRQQDGKTPENVRKRIPFDDEESDAAQKQGGAVSRNRSKPKQADMEEELVVMYQAHESGDETGDADSSGDEKILDAKGGDGNGNKTSSMKRKRSRISKGTQPAVPAGRKPSRRSRSESNDSTDRRKRKPRSEDELPGKSLKEAADEAEIKKSPRKRKSPEKLGTSPKRRRANTHPTKRQGEKSTEKEQGKEGDAGNVNINKQNEPANAGAILMKSFTRDLEMSRVGRLRATDYGCLKGKLARVRRFHKNLYQIMKARKGDTVDVVSAHHIAVDEARETPILGRFSFLSVLKDMTVREYAATVGIYVDHGDAIKAIEGKKVDSVLDEMGDDITSTTASRQVQQFVQTMTKLELIQLDADSQWFLAGAGIIRDFGRGLPSGVVPHGIRFSSFNAVEEYWLELEQFSRCKMSRRPITIDLRKEEDAKHVEVHPIGDLYFPKRWEMGVHRLQKGDQLTYERILQSMSGVEIILEEKARLRPDNFIQGKLKRFSIEELHKEMDDFLKDSNTKNGLSLPMKRGLFMEQLLLYSRFRSSNPLPKWFLKNVGAPTQGSSEKADGDKTPLLDNSCLLQLTTTPSSIKGLQVRAAGPSVFDTNQHRYFKTRAKPKPTKKVAPEGQVDLRQMIPLVTAILRGRAVAYATSDSEGLDWKIIPSLARYELQLSAESLREAADQENLRRAIVGLCEITTVRAALDILSLKLVLKIHEMATRRTGDEDLEPWSAERIRIAAIDLISDCDMLDKVCSAVIMEFRDDVRHYAKVCIYTDMNSTDLQDASTRRNVLKAEFRIAEFLHARPKSFPHEIELMASRFRKVADIRLFREVRCAVLLSPPYGETTGEEWPQGVDKTRVEELTRSGKKDPLRTETEHDKTSRARTAGQVDDAAGVNEKHSRDMQGEKSASQTASNRARVPAQESGRTGSVQDAGEQTPTSNVVDTVQPVKSIQRVPPGLFSEAQDSSFYRHAQSTAPRSLPGIAELAVCAVVRQPPHAQWKSDCLKLLSHFREEDLADARDRLILRGSISIHTARGSAHSCLQPCKRGRPTEIMSMLRGDKGGYCKWNDELKERADGCVENTKLWNDVCGFEGASSFAMAYVTSAAFFANAGIELIPEFEEDDEAAAHDEEKEDEEKEDDEEDEEAEGEDDGLTRVKLFFHVDQDKGSQAQSGKRPARKESVSKAVDEGLCTRYRERVNHEIGGTGRQGISLETLVRRLNPHFEAERVALSKAIEGLVADGDIRRYAVETDEKELHMTSGIVYMQRRYAIGMSAWQGPDGKVDEQLLRNVRDEIIEVVLRSPGCKYVDVINSVCAKQTSLPRRAVADIVFSLDGAILTSRTAIWQERWRLMRRNGSFVDENAIMTWGRRYVQSVSGNVSEFHRIENFQRRWRHRLSQLL